MRRIEYPSAISIPVTAEFLTASEAAVGVRGLLDIIHTGYAAQFEGESGLRPGTVAAKYSPKVAENVARYQQRTREHYAAGSQIVVVRSRYPDTTNHWQAFAKTSPAPAMTDGEFKGCYVNDVIARPPHRFGWGSIALHAALHWGDHGEGDRIVLEAFTDSSVNKWYERIGLVPMPDIPADPFEFNADKLPMTWYGTPEGSDLRDVVSHLERHNPNLRNSYENSAH